MPFKAKSSGCEILEWKFNANIARNVTHDGHLGPKFCLIWVKNGKKTYYFQEFHFSQS